MDVQMKPSRPQTRHIQAVNKPKQSRRIGKMSIWLISLVAVLIVGAVTYALLFGPSQVDKDRYQAVFLTNGQVYFGKLHGYETNRPYLTDVYYFPLSEDDQAEQQSLIKLGSEMHQPDNQMLLNRDAILFVENLSNDGSVVQAIERN